MKLFLSFGILRTSFCFYALVIQKIFHLFFFSTFYSSWKQNVDFSTFYNTLLSLLGVHINWIFEINSVWFFPKELTWMHSLVGILDELWKMNPKISSDGPRHDKTAFGHLWRASACSLIRGSFYIVWPG